MRDPKCKLFDVYLDGEQIFNCTVADEGQGYVRRVYDRKTPNIRQEDTYGHVQIVRKGEKPQK